MNLGVVILAAGQGTRMKSPYPKVLHPLAGDPLIFHVIDSVQELSPQHLVIVVGYKASLVKEALKGYKANFVLQKEQLGTGHAVLCTKEYFSSFEGHILVLCGDTPLISSLTLKKLFHAHQESLASVTVLTACLEDPTGYGRIIREKDNLIQKIVEEKDASSEEKKIKEINTGIYIFEKEFLFKALENIKPHNVQKEYYLTDVVEIAFKEKKKVQAVKAENPEEILGINSQSQRAYLEDILQRRLREQAMNKGVVFIKPETVYIERRVNIHPGAIIYPFVVLKGKTEIGSRCIINSFCFLENVILKEGVEIKAGSNLQNKEISSPKDFFEYTFLAATE